MRMIFGLVLLVGLALAGFAVHMAQNYIGAYQNALAEERGKAKDSVPTTAVYVAANALRYGQPLTPEDVREVGWPQNAIPEGAFTVEAGGLLSEDEDEGRVVLRAMEKDEAIMAVKVSEPGGDAGINARLAAGMRAFAIEVDVASGVSGFLRPGDRVDIYWTGRAPGGNGGEITKLIQTAVKLIAVDQTANDDSLETNIARTVTVEATPQQVASLAQAQATGALTLSLVGANDTTVAEAVQVDQRGLLGIEREEKEVVQAEKEEVCTIRTRRGAEVVEIPIPCTN